MEILSPTVSGRAGVGRIKTQIPGNESLVMLPQKNTQIRKIQRNSPFIRNPVSSIIYMSVSSLL
jgi:hypothetical protein